MDKPIPVCMSRFLHVYTLLVQVSYRIQGVTEADITYQISEILNRMWDLQQWWASVSFGVLAAAYFVGKKINGALLSILLLLYTIYSVYMWDLLSLNVKVLSAYVSDLQAISDSGVELSIGTQAHLIQPRLGRFLAPVALIGTYVSVMCYSLYVFFLRETRPDA